MKATFKTSDELLAEGFKRDYPYFYKGEKRNPEARVRHHWVDNLGGKTGKIVGIENHEVGEFCFEYQDKIYRVSTWMLRETILFNQIKNPQQLMLRGKPAKFYGTLFSFNCAHEELSVKDAVKLAHWVLKVSQDKL